jgi:hypothetical protein
MPKKAGVGNDQAGDDQRDKPATQDERHEKGFGRHTALLFGGRILILLAPANKNRPYKPSSLT